MSAMGLKVDALQINKTKEKNSFAIITVLRTSLPATLHSL